MACAKMRSLFSFLSLDILVDIPLSVPLKHIMLRVRKSNQPHSASLTKAESGAFERLCARASVELPSFLP